MPIDNINNHFKDIDKLLALDQKSFGTSSDITTSEVESVDEKTGCSLMKFDTTSSDDHEKSEETKIAEFLENF